MDAWLSLFHESSPGMETFSRKLQMSYASVGTENPGPIAIHNSASKEKNDG